MLPYWWRESWTEHQTVKMTGWLRYGVIMGGSYQTTANGHRCPSVLNCVRACMSVRVRVCVWGGKVHGRLIFSEHIHQKCYLKHNIHQNQLRKYTCTRSCGFLMSLDKGNIPGNVMYPEGEQTLRHNRCEKTWQAPDCGHSCGNNAPLQRQTHDRHVNWLLQHSQLLPRL